MPLAIIAHALSRAVLTHDSWVSPTALAQFCRPRCSMHTLQFTFASFNTFTVIQTAGTTRNSVINPAFRNFFRIFFFMSIPHIRMRCICNGRFQPYRRVQNKMYFHYTSHRLTGEQDYLKKRACNNVRWNSKVRASIE